MKKKAILILGTLAQCSAELLGWMLLASALEALFILGIRNLILSQFSDSALSFIWPLSLQSNLIFLLVIVLCRTFFQWRFHKKASFLSVRRMQNLRREIMDYRLKSKNPQYRDPQLEDYKKEMLHGLPLFQKGTLSFFQSQSAALQLMLFCLLLPLFPLPYFIGLFLIALPAALFSKIRISYLQKVNLQQEKASGKALMLMEKFLEKLEFLIPNHFLKTQNQILAQRLAQKEKSLISWEATQAFFPAVMEGFYFVGLSFLFSGLYIFFPGSLQNPELIAFGALMLLMYKPLRDWTRSYPQWLQAREFEKKARLYMNHSTPPKIWEKNSRDSMEIAGLKFGYRNNQYIWQSLNISWNAYQFCCISAPNGWGKSSLLKIICGLEFPERGSIYIPNELWEKQMPAFFYLPQRAQLTAAHFEILHNYSNCYPERYMELCDILQLAHLLKPYVNDPKKYWEDIWSLQERLSGGQLQRICLATAFACENRYLLLDEPTTWLPGNSRVQILKELLKFRSRNSLSSKPPGLLCVTHEEDLKPLFHHQILTNAISGSKNING